MQQCCIMRKEEIYSVIREKGGRITKIKKEIIDILLLSKCLIPLSDIKKEIKRRGLSPNRSTIYRELSFLRESGIIKKRTLKEDFFEINSSHNHLICVSCNKLKKIKNNIKIAKTNNFINYSFDIYGICKDCQKSTNI